MISRIVLPIEDNSNLHRIISVSISFRQSSVLCTKDVRFCTVEKNVNVSREDNSGFGLSMMRERLFLLSGELVIESAPDKGCSVKAYIPVNEEDMK